MPAHKCALEVLAPKARQSERILEISESHATVCQGNTDFFEQDEAESVESKYSPDRISLIDLISNILSGL